MIPQSSQPSVSVHALAASPTGLRRVGHADPGYLAAGTFVLAAAASLTLALTLPLATAVLALVLFGLLHNVSELRYLAGRFGPALDRSLAVVLVASITPIALARVLPLGSWGPAVEIGMGYGLLVVVLVWTLCDRLAVLVPAVGAVLVGATVSLLWPDYHFVVITHLHNLVPLFFLWEWSRRLENGRARQAFRLTLVGWGVALPAALLLGTLDGLASGNLSAGGSLVPSVGALIASYTPPAWRESALAVRFLTLFAFLQLMHYVVWCAFIPVVARREVASFDRALSASGLPSGRRLTGISLGAAALLALLFVADYQSGRSLYGAVAAYHAYLEYPIMLLFLLGIGRTGPASIEGGE